MKRLVSIVSAMAIVMAIGVGCRPASEIEAERLARESRAGMWIVVSTNCPDVLAKRNREELETFKFLNSIGTSTGCEKVAPGWIIQVGKRGRNNFFPPPTK